MPPHLHIPRHARLASNRHSKLMTSLVVLQMKSSDDLVYRDMLRYTADVAILLSISQCLLHLKSPNVSAREKQVLKRELGDEMVRSLHHMS